MWWFKKKNKESRFKSILRSLDGINMHIVEDVYSSEYSLVTIPTIVPTINEYISLLDTILNAFKTESLLYFSLVSQDTNIYYLRDFYLSKGSYIDTVTITRTFIQKAKEFIVLYEELEKADRTFIIEKNLSITGSVINNIPVLVSYIT